MSEGCRLCSGQGSFGAFGACGAGDMHRRGACPCCNGSTRTNYNVQCPPCKGQGGVGAFGPCLPFDTHYKGACRACEGRGYHFPGTTFTPCAPCQGKGGMGTFGPCSPTEVHFKSLCGPCGGKGVIIGQAYAPQPVAYQPVPQPVAYPQPVPVSPTMGFPGMSVSMPGMTFSMPGMTVTTSMPAPVVAPVVVHTIDQVIHCNRHAHDLRYSGHITGKICDICRSRLGTGYQCQPCKFDLCMGCFNTLRSQGQVTIPSVVPAPVPVASAPRGRFYLTSAHKTQLSATDRGSFGPSPNRAGWEVLTIHDAGNGRVLLSTAHNTQLSCSDTGALSQSPNRAGWEQWTLQSAGNGKWYIVAHTGNHLGMGDNGSIYCSNRNTGAWEQWELSSA